MRNSVFAMACVLAIMVAAAAFAGNLDQAASPTSPGGGAMYTLEDIYQRLATGAAGAKRPGPFAEPTSGPGATGHTLDEVMGKAPAVDNTDGATAGDVLNNKTFWGLNTTTGVWGLQTGTLACAATATGTATAGDVLATKTFSNSSANGITGTMANKAGTSFTPGTTAQTIAAGYYDGSGTVAGDPNLTAANIVSGKTIFGVNGSASAATVPAPVPGTGQIGCWDAGGTSVPCAGTGQDGDKLKGVANPSPRFTDNSNGTVTDNLTGLIWLRNANCFLGGLNWATALTNVNGLANGSCSLTDGSTAGQWRLPNLRELQSLIDYQNEDHALPAGYSSFFSNVQAGFYWSATTRIADKTNAWLVDMNGGVDFHAKTFVGPVWPVR